jgi:hypothetical protein
VRVLLGGRNLREFSGPGLIEWNTLGGSTWTISLGYHTRNHGHGAETGFTCCCLRSAACMSYMTRKVKIATKIDNLNNLSTKIANKETLQKKRYRANIFLSLYLTPLSFKLY